MHFAQYDFDKIIMEKIIPLIKKEKEKFYIIQFYVFYFYTALELFEYGKLKVIDKVTFLF
jgi:hypothetical protein